jgi:hypothetical protein
MAPYANVDTSDANDSHRVATLTALINIVVADLDAAPLSSGPIAIRLLLLIAWHEGARLTQRTQLGGGPARSFYQLQAASAATAYNSSYMTSDRLYLLAGLLNVSQDAIMNDFLALGSGASFPAGNLVARGLVESDLFGSYLARILMKTIPGALPQPDPSYASEANFWLDHWHTSTGDDTTDNQLKTQFISDCRAIDPYLPSLTEAYAASREIQAAAISLLRELVGGNANRRSPVPGLESLEISIGSQAQHGLNIGFKVTCKSADLDSGESVVQRAFEEVREEANSSSSALLYATHMETQAAPAPPSPGPGDSTLGAPGRPEASPIAKPTLESVAQFWSDSCAGGDHYPNNCAHFLSDAFIRAGFSELSGGVSCIQARCSTSAKRPIRARDMWCWFQAKATKTSSVLTKNTGWWVVFQLDEETYWGGHVVLFDSDSWKYYGTGWYPNWSQHMYQW